MRKTYAWMVASAAACLMTPDSGAAAGSQANRIARIEARLEPTVVVRGRPVHAQPLAEAMAAHHTPSISIAVANHGRIVWAKAYGLADVASGRPATETTLYQAGSISKPVAASGAMRLVDESRLVLDVPANSLLKSWKIPDNAFTQDHPVTLRQLLSHTAGTTVHGFPGYAAGAPVPTVVEVLEGKGPANTPAVVVERQPGSFWNYSGGGITIAQLMMTDAAQQSFPHLMRERVFDPLGMTDSTFEQPLPAELAPGAATGYQRDGAAVGGRFHTYPEMAAAGLWTTPTDLAKWAIGLERAYDGSDSKLMSRASAKAMLAPGLGQWGLGVGVGGEGDDFEFHHSGDDAGFTAQLMAWPKGGRAIVAMSNGDDGMVVVGELMQAVAKEYGWKGLEPHVIDEVKLSQAQLEEVSGGYGRGMVVIAAKGPDLSLTYGGSTVDLIPQGGDKFIADPGGANVDISLGRGPDGKVSSVAALGLVIPRDR